MGRLLHIACLQTEPVPDVDSALAQALTLAKTAVADGAQFLLLPEYCGGLATKGAAFAPPIYSEDTHPVLLGLIEFAMQNGVWILIGSIAITGSSGKYRNRSYMIGNNGEILARYDKINLFDISVSDTKHYRESDSVEAGGQLVVVDLPFARVGLSICYDLRFPQLYRELAQAGAEILVVPAAFTKKTGALHWHVLNRARAIENAAFVCSPCAIGAISGGGGSYGHSLIVNPIGDVLADGGESPGVVQKIIDLDDVKRAREKIPSWQINANCALHQTNKKAIA